MHAHNFLLFINFFFIFLKRNICFECDQQAPAEKLMIKNNKTKKNDILSQNYKYKRNETKRARGIWARQHQRQKIQTRGEERRVLEHIFL